MSNLTDNPLVEEPHEHERVFYRHRDTGELAYLVRLDGKAKLRLNRPGETVLKAMSEMWVKEEAARYDIAPMQRAKVTFAADRELCLLLGLPTLARRDWQMLRDQQRIAWMQNGPEPTGDPTKDRVRHQVWKRLSATLEALR